MRCEPEWESVGSSWRLIPESGVRLYVHPGKKMFYWYCTLEDNVQPYVGAPSAVSGISRTAANAKKACITAWHEIKKGMNDV